MTVADLAFYAFSIVTVASALMVTLSRNPVHSVLWLILAFLSSAGLFVLLGAEFVAMLLIIVYVGAVAVLFLFVVMMLDIDFAELKGEMAKYMPLGHAGRRGRIDATGLGRRCLGFIGRGRQPTRRCDAGCRQNRKYPRFGHADL